MMNYEETVDYILNIPLFAQKIGTENLANLLCRLGNPEKKSRVIHVAGTNGKGSTSMALAQILMEAGYKVGLFTSPHLVTINERIRINGKLINNEDFVECFNLVKEKIDIHPSFFELIFAMSAVYFEKEKCDFVIYETGMGGRLDATNCVAPEVTIITSVGMDHMKYLGNTISEIAYEKAGIIKKNVPIITFKRDQQAYKVIEEQASLKDSPLISMEKCQYIINKIDNKNIDFSFHNRYYKYENLRIKRTALYQVENAILAVIAADILLKEKGEMAIRKGLLNFFWEGRMEEIYPDIVVDGAHNVEAILSYVSTMNALYSNVKKILVFAVVKDKEYDEMIHILCENLQFHEIIVSGLKNERQTPALKVETIFKQEQKAPVFAFDSIGVAMDKAIADKNKLEQEYQKNSNHEEMKIFCVGSLYLVGEVKNWLDKHLEK